MLRKRVLRVGNISGATGDRQWAMKRMLESGDVEVITGDWLSEMNIAWNAIAMQADHSTGYENGFYEQLEECLDVITAKGIKVITNAGALNTLGLFTKVQELCTNRNHDVTVAAVIGDDVSDIITDPTERSKIDLKHLDDPDRRLNDWKLDPLCANAYIGCGGIAKALELGAQIVICGRVTDASPVMGAAKWYFGWDEDQYDELAGALVAGHLIECGAYVVGANFSGFKEFLPDLVDLAYPVAELDANGQCVITKTREGGGHVTTETVTAQLLYELQGHLYLNPDVVADLSKVQLEAEGADRVRVNGVQGLPPPSTTKVMIAASGRFQAETTFFVNGLDVSAKVALMKQQLAYMFRCHNFSKFAIELYGTEEPNPISQQAGTVQLREFAQARYREDIAAAKFKIPMYALRMQSYPGYHMNLDFRTMDPKPFMEIFPTTMPMLMIKQQVRLLSAAHVDVNAPKRTTEYPMERPSYETTQPVDLLSLGDTQLAPLGSIVHTRSGDKADKSNIGSFVRHEDHYPWLQTILTVKCLKQLLGTDWTRLNVNRRVERIEFPGILAVHL